MVDYQQFFAWPEVQIEHFYVYLAIAFLIAAYLVITSPVRYRLEVFCLSFYLLTGNVNNILTFKIPGFTLFEIQPIRFLFFLFCFFILRKTLLSRERLSISMDNRVPWFMIALILFVLLLITSTLYNSGVMEIRDVLEEIYNALAFVVLIFALALMRDKAAYDVFGRAIIVGGVVSSLVSLVQLGIDPYFLRIGEAREAFGNIIRSNGIFSTEYFNSYFLIVAATWTLYHVKNQSWKAILIFLFILGVLSSFQRMSWIILALVLLVYLIKIQKISFDKLALIGLGGLTVILTVSLLFYRDIKNSEMVQERLSQSIKGRIGYYSMVIDNIGDRPLFGYGDLKNEVYYTNMLKITGNRARATAEAGDLHSGYFSALFLYGIPAFLCFTAFVILAVRYYSRALRTDLYYAIPFLVSILFLVGNLTNTFLFLKYISILFAIHIGIGLGISQIQEHRPKKRKKAASWIPQANLRNT